MASLLSELRDAGLVTPDFKHSNMEVLRQVARGSGAYAGDKGKKIFLVIDGFGYNVLRRMLQRSARLKEIIGRARVERLTTIYPSFTLSVLSSVDSGQTVSQHGIVGEKVPLREAGTIVSILSFAPQHDPRIRLSDDYFKFVYPVPRVINALRNKYRFLYVQDEGIMNKEYTRAMFGDTDSIPYISFEDMLFQIAKVVKAGKYQRVYAYHPLVDHAEHTYGPNSPELANILEGAVLSIGRILLPALAGSDYSLVITADHGQTEVGSRDVAGLECGSAMMDCLNMPMWGMGRAPIFSVTAGMERKFEERFHKKWGRKAMLVESDELIRSGIFGKRSVDSSIRYRFGTHAAIAKDSTYFNYIYPGRKPKARKSKFGHHGGMSADEMEIPLLIY